jgi:hypothetical protein
MENATAGNYLVEAFDLSGRRIATQTVAVSTAMQQATLETFDWKAGVYQIRISKDGQVHTLPVVKQ